MTDIDSIKGLVETAESSGKRISEVVLEFESRKLNQTPWRLLKKMEETFDVMEEAVQMGLKLELKSPSGLSGGNAIKLSRFIDKCNINSGVFAKAMVKAVAVSEYNACMGKIVAAPTAGSSGILPAVLLTAQEEYGISKDKVVRSLFTSAGIGMVIAKQASISGAKGGCQAECGSASSMAAAALVELLDGTPAMAAHACAIALKNILGLVCDPVAGLVEVPCVKRNASGAVNSFEAAILALAGIESTIPADEVILAMGKVGNQMTWELKESAEGGLAATKTAREISCRLGYQQHA